MSEQMPWRISPFPQEPEARQRERLAERTRRLVLEEFRRVAENSDEDVAFDAALDAYCRRHADVPRHVALYAVAEILAEPASAELILVGCADERARVDG